MMTYTFESSWSVGHSGSLWAKILQSTNWIPCTPICEWIPAGQKTCRIRLLLCFYCARFCLWHWDWSLSHYTSTNCPAFGCCHSVHGRSGNWILDRVFCLRVLCLYWSRLWWWGWLCWLWFLPAKIVTLNLEADYYLCYFNYRERSLTKQIFRIASQQSA